MRFALGGSQTVEYIRIHDPLVFATFAYHFMKASLAVKARAQYLQEKLDYIGRAAPTNFLKYARKYLGDAYIEARVDDEDELPDEDDMSQSSSAGGMDEGSAIPDSDHV